MIDDDEFRYNYGNAQLGGKIYWNAINAVRDVWEDLYGERLEVSRVGREGLKALLLSVSQKLKEKDELPALVARLKQLGYEVGDAKSAPDLINTLAEGSSPGAEVRSIDDLTPRQFKDAIYVVAHDQAAAGKPDVKLDIFLRRVLNQVWKANNLRGRINVGTNRHFFRMYQWLLEVAYETDWGDAKGLKVMNASLRGPVRSHPEGPAGLIVRTDPAYM